MDTAGVGHVDVRGEVRRAYIHCLIAYFNAFHICLYKSLLAEIPWPITEIFFLLLSLYGQIKPIQRSTPAPMLPLSPNSVFLKQGKILIICLQCHEYRNIPCHFSQSIFLNPQIPRVISHLIRAFLVAEEALGMLGVEADFFDARKF